MLHQTLSKGWCRHGSGLLLGLIVRPHRRVVEAQPFLGATENRSACPAHRLRGFDPGHTRSVASLPQRARLLAFRLLSPALLLPEPLLPEPVQPAGKGPCARAARSATCLRPRTGRPFGRIPRPGHDARPSDGAGEGFSQGAVCRTGNLREECVQDRVGLRVQGGAGGGPQGRSERLRAGTCGLRRETHRGCPHSPRPLRCLPGGQRLHGTRVGAALAGGLWGTGGCHPEEQLPSGMVEGRSPLGVGPSSDHRGGDRPAQGLLRTGAPPGQDLERAADPLGGQDRGVHLWATDKRFPGPTVAPPGGPVSLTRCTSAVLESGVYVLPGAVSMRQALKCSGRRSLPRQGEVVWEQAPSTSAPQDVEDGVQYLARLVSSGTSARFGPGNERLEDLPYVIAEVGRVGASVGHGKATPSRFGSRILLLQAPSQTPSKKFALLRPNTGERTGLRCSRRS